MARKPRIQYPGAIYHAMSRKGHLEEIFKDDTDRQAFLAALAEASQKTGWPVLRSRLLRRVGRCMRIAYRPITFLWWWRPRSQTWCRA
jgi:hypothetical protein